jgi:hypothetical protein
MLVNPSDDKTARSLLHVWSPLMQCVESLRTNVEACDAVSFFPKSGHKSNVWFDLIYSLIHSRKPFLHLTYETLV